MDWSAPGDWLVSCGEDGRVNCVPFKTGAQDVLLLSADKAIWSVAWSPDNKWIAAVGEEGRAWIWSASFAQEVSPAESAENGHPPQHAAHPKRTPKKHHHH